MKIRKTNLECALESTVSLLASHFTVADWACGERVAQDSLLKSCGFSRVFDQAVKCRKSEMRDLALHGPGEGAEVRQKIRNSQNEPGMCPGINSFTFWPLNFTVAD